MSALIDRNRRLIAQRTGWPAGAAEACERLERQYPGWCASWFPPSNVRGVQREAGFYAWIEGECPLVKSPGGGGYQLRREHYGATAEALGRELARRV